MLNLATAQPISQILLFETGTPQQVRELGENARLISDGYKRLLGVNSLVDADHFMESKYTVIFAVPETRGLAACCEEMAARLKTAGIRAFEARVKEDDMFLCQGKIGLLSCVLWCIGGSVLLNEVPISQDQSEKLLQQANRFHYTDHHLVLLRQGWFRQEFRFGLLRGASSIGQLLRGRFVFRDGHTLSDILRAMKANCSAEDLYVVG